MSCKAKTFLAIAVVAGAGYFPGSQGAAQESSYFNWIIKHPKWESEHEQQYQRLIHAIGENVEGRLLHSINPDDDRYKKYAGKCVKLEACLEDKSVNFLLDENGTDRQVDFSHADCSKLAHIVRAYIAWKNHLPFSFVTSVERRFEEKDKGKDIRYTRGNRVELRNDVVTEPDKPAVNIKSVINGIKNHVSSATMRVLYDKGKDTLAPDFYTAELNKTKIQAGTVIYDPDGHVVVVYKIEPSGRVWYVDSHPDDSLTIGLYGPKFDRGGPWAGAGFKNWRPIELRGAQQDAGGALIGGKIHLGGTEHDEPLDKLTQYLGTKKPLPTLDDWQKAKFVINGKNETIYDYVRFVVSTDAQSLKLNPNTEMASEMLGLCFDAQARAEAVTSASKKPEKAGTLPIALSEHPSRLPDNIYGTSGEWETYSTPSRDARLKTSFVSLRASMARIIQLSEKADPSIDYTGTNLKKDLLDTYDRLVRGCVVNYHNTSGAKVALNLNTVRKRLFALSFDPYHCPELRWGGSKAELDSCPQQASADQTKMEWYKAERRLRNQNRRIYDEKMSYALDQLKSGADAKVGLDTPENVCIEQLLGRPPC